MSRGDSNKEPFNGLGVSGEWRLRSLNPMLFTAHFSRGHSMVEVWSSGDCSAMKGLIVKGPVGTGRPSDCLLPLHINHLKSPAVSFSEGTDAGTLGLGYVMYGQFSTSWLKPSFSISAKFKSEEPFRTRIGHCRGGVGAGDR